MKLLTTISENYVPDWSFYEGVRELVQNGLDAQDKGFRFDIVYLRERRELLIYNDGPYLTRSNFLLGNTSKRGDETQRGMYGEGFKIGVLALIRDGRNVTIINGKQNEVIKSSLEQHPDYGGVKVLCFDFEKSDGILPIDRGKLIIKVEGVDPKDVAHIKDRFLDWDGLELGRFYKTELGRVLLDEKYKGMVFSRGIFVCSINKLAYGYDFYNLKLGRDRNLASEYDIIWDTSKMWSYLGATHKKDSFVIEMLKSNAPDVEQLHYFTKHKLQESIFEQFKNENGEKSYPCSSEYQKKEIASLGYKPIFVSESHKKVIEKSLPSLFDIKKKQALSKIDQVDITKIFSDLMANGWRIKYYPCDCGGKYAWIRPDGNGDFYIHGCICHNTPLENLD